MSAATEKQQEKEEKFHFLFMGSYKQLEFFVNEAKTRLPEVEIKAYKDKKSDDYICTMQPDCQNAFLVGGILTACYAAFQEQHNNSKNEL